MATDDRDVTSDDPCLKCRCNRGLMTCSKKACPVLQCPPSRQDHPRGECCPRCTGTRSLYTVRNKCFFSTYVYEENEKFDIDKCTTCSCSNETSICKRNSCDILDCSPDFQKKIPGRCCKICVMPEESRTQCSYEGTTYEASNFD